MDLTNFLAPKAARLLVQGILDEVYLQGLGNGKSTQDDVDHDDDPTRYPWAPKLSPDDRRVDWNGWTALEIFRRQRVLGPLWNMAQTQTPTTDQDSGSESSPLIKRVIFEWMREVTPSSERSRPSPGSRSPDENSALTPFDLLEKDKHIVKMPGVPFLAKMKKTNPPT